MENTLRSVLGLITVIILKKVRERIFFQSNKLTTCKDTDGKEVAKSMMVLNLRKIIYLFQSKNLVRTS